MTRDRVAGSNLLGALRALVTEWQREGRELHEQAAGSVLYADELEARADALEECAAGLELAAGLLEAPRPASDPRQLSLAELAELAPLESQRELARELMRADELRAELEREREARCAGCGAHPTGLDDLNRPSCAPCAAGRRAHETVQRWGGR